MIFYVDVICDCRFVLLCLLTSILQYTVCMYVCLCVCNLLWFSMNKFVDCCEKALCQTIVGRKSDFDNIVEKACQLDDVGTTAVVNCQQLRARYDVVCHAAQV